MVDTLNHRRPNLRVHVFVCVCVCMILYVRLCDMKDPHNYK